MYTGLGECYCYYVFYIGNQCKHWWFHKYPFIHCPINIYMTFYMMRWSRTLALHRTFLEKMYLMTLHYCVYRISLQLWRLRSCIHLSSKTAHRAGVGLSRGYTHTHIDRQPFTLRLTPTGNFQSSIHLPCIFELWVETRAPGGNPQGEHEDSTQKTALNWREDSNPACPWFIPVNPTHALPTLRPPN